MKCKDCTKEGCSFRCYTEEGECSYDNISVNNFDWQSFRAEAAKDILCSVLNGSIASGATGFINEKEDIVKGAIDVADELIKQLKEKEEK